MPHRVAIAFAICALCLALLLAGCRAPSGPREVAWDREACAHCHMLVGDPAFAAQLTTRAGDSLVFDDPGCLFAYQARHPETTGVFFHHFAEDRWIAAADVGFVAARSPMGYGLAATDARTGALSLPEAQLRVAERASR